MEIEGVTAMLEELEPSLHVYELAPKTDMLTELPEHTLELGANTDNAGDGRTVKFKFVEDMQPVKVLVPETLFNTLTLGVITMDEVVALLLHV